MVEKTQQEISEKTEERLFLKQEAQRGLAERLEKVRNRRKQCLSDI